MSPIRNSTCRDPFLRRCGREGWQFNREQDFRPQLFLRSRGGELLDTPQMSAKGMQPLFTRTFPWWKRLIDVVGALGAIIAFAPLMLVIAAAIRFTSSGPALFKQRRAGLGGIPFTVYKFRTMGVDAEARKSELMQFNERQGPAFKMKTDPRVTRVGAFLRKTSLDELPQFFNVLEGNMSLVGPRPLPVSETDASDVWHRARLDVKPGITCIWQITSRDESCFDSWVRQDIEYIRGLSFWGDLRLLFMTIPAVLARRGAY